MRKTIIIIIIVIFIIPIKVFGIGESASSYIIMDQNTNRVLLSKNMNNQRLIASITKIMTCMIAIESNRLDETVIVDNSIISSYGSGIYIEIGEELTLRDLLYGLMLRSGNDAALMISSFVSGSEEEMVKKMNSRAKELGMKNTIFNNSSGLDNDKGNYSTSYDMALLTSYAMKYDEYRKIVGTEKYVLKTNYKTYIWYNKNKLLSLDYITGGKTGFTEKAKRTLVSTATKDNMDLVSVTLNDGNDWDNHKNLYEYVFNNYKRYKVLNKNNFKVNDDNYYNNSNLYIKNDVYVLLKDEEVSKVRNEIKLEKLKNLTNGDKVGKSCIYINDEMITCEDIYIKVEKKTQEKNIFEKILEWFKHD